MVVFVLKTHFPFFSTIFLHFLPLFTTNPQKTSKNADESIGANIGTKKNNFLLITDTQRDGEAMYTNVYIWASEVWFFIFWLPCIIM